MNIYTEEFKGFLEKVEGSIVNRFGKLLEHYGSDSMIEARNMTIGDSNCFPSAQAVGLETHQVDLSDALDFLSRKSEHEVGEMIWDKLKKDISERIEDSFENTNVQPKSLKDVRKVMRVVAETEVFIHPKNFVLNYRMGIGFREN